MSTEVDSLKIIITGGAGCIGFATIQALLSHHANASIHVLDIIIPSFQYSNNNIQYHKVDITNASAVNSSFQAIKPKAIIHTASVIPSAARKQHFSNERLWDVNVNGTKNVLNAAEQVGTVEALVYTSSCDAVKPDSWMNFANANEKDTAYLMDAEKWDSEYPRTKAAAEKLVLAEERKIKTCAIRTHAVIGTLDQNLFPLVATSPRKISLGSGKNLYDFSSADNVAQAHVLAMNNLLSIDASAKRRAFFVSDGRPKPFRELQEMIWRVVDRNGDNDAVAAQEKSYGGYTAIPVWLFAGILRFMRLLGVKTQITPQEIGDAVAVRYYDISEARSVLGYDPSKKTLEESIREACLWWRQGEGGQGQI
ncbi:hypothetical protein UA08_08848 [Talaromyces atroroseus]|uniref:3-beta hydroxysteroid dehydrogenase/isomerase domain-containing protein n=1 Tax=Talaromyces atroroseus TaxID=1441469 RepID=A0A225AN69_TALAT|nr:hypothetical protein UA08_08848 [Talaromyces atroroseus]OKL55875.1 hypothetical protein UA08_08848 [Talaromyces atroroseus]